MKENVIMINGYSFVIKSINERYLKNLNTMILTMEDTTKLYVSADNVISYDDDSIVIKNLKNLLENDESEIITPNVVKSNKNCESKALVSNEKHSILFDVKSPEYDEFGRAVLCLKDKSKLYISSKNVMFFDASSLMMEQIISFLAHDGKNVYKQEEKEFVKIRTYNLKHKGGSLW